MNYDSRSLKNEWLNDQYSTSFKNRTGLLNDSERSNRGKISTGKRTVERVVLLTDI